MANWFCSVVNVVCVVNVCPVHAVGLNQLTLCGLSSSLHKMHKKYFGLLHILRSNSNLSKYVRRPSHCAAHLVPIVEIVLCLSSGITKSHAGDIPFFSCICVGIYFTASAFARQSSNHSTILKLLHLQF